jgi:NAD(P) transhydrogenase subunit alpha
MYTKNMQGFLGLLMGEDGALALDFDDEIIKGTCVTHEEWIMHDAVRQVVEGGTRA